MPRVRTYGMKRADLIYEKLLSIVRESAPGSLLPSFNEMKKKWQTGQLSINRALDRLVEEGLIEKKPRVGIVVCSQEEETKNGSHEVLDTVMQIDRNLSCTVNCHISNLESQEMWIELRNSYQQMHPEHKVNLNFQSDTKIVEEMKKGIPMVALLCDNETFISQAFDGRLFQNLDIFASSLGDLGQYCKGTWYRDNKQRLVGIAPYLVSEVMFANTKLLKNTGMSLPDSSWDWQCFRNMATQAQRHGNVRYGHIFYRYITYFAYRGLKFFNPETHTMSINTAAMHESCRFLRDLIKTDHIAPLPTDLESKEEILNTFMAGDCVFLRGDTHLIKSYLSSRAPADLEWQPLQVPGENTDSLPLNGPMLALNARSFYYEEGWEFINFVLSEAGQQIITRHRTDLPVLKTVAPNPGLGKGAADAVQTMQQIREKGTLYYMSNLVLIHLYPLISSVVNRWITYGGDLGTMLDCAEAIAEDILKQQEIIK